MRSLRTALAILATLVWCASATADGVSYVPPRTGNLFTLWSADPTDLTPGNCLQITALINATGSGANCGSGVNSVTTDCPVSAPLIGAVTLSGLLSNSRTVSGTTDALLSTDCGGIVQYTNAGSIAVSVAAAASTGFPIGYWTGIKTSGAGTVTVTPASGTINGAGTLVVSAGCDLQLVSFGSGVYITMNGSGSCGGGGSGTVNSSTAGNYGFYNTTGTAISGQAPGIAGNCAVFGANPPFADKGIRCPQAFPSLVGTFKPAVPGIFTAAGTNMGIGKITCIPVIINEHWDEILANISTLAAGGNVQIALYPNGTNTTVSPNFNAPLGNPSQTPSTSLSTGSAGALVWVLGSTPSLGPQWVCYNVDNSTVIFTATSANTTVINNMTGAPTAVGVLSSTNLVGLQFTGTFGTWPTFTASSAFASLGGTTVPNTNYRVGP